MAQAFHLCHCSVHERFVQAAANTDQIADSIAAGQQPEVKVPAAVHADSPYISHTPSPHLSQAALQQQSQPGSGAELQQAAGRVTDDQEAMPQLLIGSPYNVGNATPAATASEGMQPHDADSKTETDPKSDQDATNTRPLQSSPLQGQGLEPSVSSATENEVLHDSPGSSPVSIEASFASQAGSEQPLVRRPLASVQEGHHAALGRQASTKGGEQQQHADTCAVIAKYLTSCKAN